MCAKQFHLGGRDADAVLGSQGMYVGGRTLVKGLQWTHLFLWNPATHHTLNRKLCRYTLKSSQDHQEKNVLWCRCGLKRIIFPLIVAAGHKSGDVLGLIGARTLAMLNAILSTYCNSSDKSNTKNTRNTSNISNASLGMY